MSSALDAPRKKKDYKFKGPELAHIREIIDFSGRVCQELYANWKKQLGPADLARFHVDLTPLDLVHDVAPSPGPDDHDDGSTDQDSGDITSDMRNFLFVRPLAFSTADAWLRELRPWKYLPWGPGGSELGFFRSYDDWDEGPWWDAHRLTDKLINYACRSGVAIDEKHNEPGLVSRAGWRYYQEHPPRGMSSANAQSHHRVEGLLEHADPTAPHFVACISSYDPPCDGSLTAVELQTVLQAGGLRIKWGIGNRPPHKPFRPVLGRRIIPITLISAGEQQVRVLHAYVDAEARLVRVRASPVLDFSGGRDESDLEDVTRLLCWMLAEPAGEETTPAGEETT